MSDAHICQEHESVGVGVHAAAAFWALNLMHIPHCQTVSSMALLIPGQNIQLQAINCVLVMPWCDWC